MSQRQCLFFFRLLDLGFERDVSSILTAIQKALFPGVKCQTVLLSATLNEGTVSVKYDKSKLWAPFSHAAFSGAGKGDSPLPAFASACWSSFNQSRKSAMIATKGAKAMLSNEVLLIRSTFPDLPSRAQLLKARLS